MISYYFLFINIVGIVSMGIDKKLAVWHKRRISEKNLLLIACLGGCIGSIIGMYTFRHKTMKAKFYIGFWVILFAQCILYYIVRSYI